MDILVVAPYYTPYNGVGAKRIVSLTSYLLSKHNISIVAFDKSLYKKELCIDESPEGIKLYSTKSVASKRLYSLSLKKTIRKAIKCNSYDLCICTVGPYDSLFFIKMIKSRVGKVVIDYRDNWIGNCDKDSHFIRLSNRIKEIVERIAFDNADAIVCVSEKQRELIQNKYKLRDTKIFAVYNGFDDSQIGDINRAIIEQDPSKVILAISGKCAYYDRDSCIELLKAIKSLRSLGYNVFLVHIGEKEGVLNTLCNKLEIPEDVLCQLGYLEYVDSIKKLLSSDILIIVNKIKEGLGTKVFDYIFVDKPVLLIQDGESELKDFVGSFEHGFTVGINSEKIIEIIKFIIDERIRNLGVRSVNDYSRKQQNIKYEEILDYVCNSNS